MSLTLLIANKTYSSWSFRPWILMRHFGIPFEEVVIPLAQETTRAEISRFSPSGKCPALRDGEILVWDSLAIIETVAELNPQLAIWPSERTARAQARSLSAEMHSGFTAMRSLLPMNMRRPVRKCARRQAPIFPVSNRPSPRPASSLAKLGRFCLANSPPQMRCLRRSSTGSTFTM
jgi:glutathione S-transferase